jgi:hypothetical protein
MVINVAVQPAGFEPGREQGPAAPGCAFLTHSAGYPVTLVTLTTQPLNHSTSDGAASNLSVCQAGAAGGIMRRRVRRRSSHKQHSKW